MLYFVWGLLKFPILTVFVKRWIFHQFSFDLDLKCILKHRYICTASNGLQCSNENPTKIWSKLLLCSWRHSFTWRPKMVFRNLFMCFLGFIRDRYRYSEPDHTQRKFGRKVGSSWFLQADWGDPQSSFSTLSLKVWDSDLWIMNQCFMQTVPLMSEDDLVSSLDLSQNISFPKFFRKYKCSIPLQWRCEIDLRLVLRPGIVSGGGWG